MIFRAEYFVRVFKYTIKESLINGTVSLTVPCCVFGVKVAVNQDLVSSIKNVCRSFS